MKTAEQIIEDAKCGNELKNYSLLELHLFLCIEQILKMYSNNQISKEKANNLKNLAIKKYNDLIKQYEFERSLFQEHVVNIKETEMLRTQLRKRLNEEDEVTEEKLAECLNLALGILDICFKEEFKNDNSSSK